MLVGDFPFLYGFDPMVNHHFSPLGRRFWELFPSIEYSNPSIRVYVMLGEKYISILPSRCPWYLLSNYGVGR